MAGIPLSTNFDVGAALHLDSRDSITLADMLTINENVWPEDKLTICKDNHKVYFFKKSNESDPTTGKFREFMPGADITIDDELSLISEHPVQNKVITIALNGKLGIKDAMPDASEEYLNTIVIYGGADTSLYKHGYFYECKGKEDVEGVVGFEPSKIGFDYQNYNLKDFFEAEKIQNYKTITHGTMTYLLAGNIWALTGYDENNNVVFSDLKLYTGDLEDYGFVFINPSSDYSDGEVIEYTTTWSSSITYYWDAMQVQDVSKSDSILYVNKLPTSNIENITYGIKEPIGVTTTIDLINPTVGRPTKEQAIKYFSQYFTVTEVDDDTLSLSVYPDLVLKRDLWSQPWVAGTYFDTLHYIVSTAQLRVLKNSVFVSESSAWGATSEYYIHCTSANFPVWNYYNGNEEEQSLIKIGSGSGGGDIEVDETTIITNQDGTIGVSPAYKKIFNGTEDEFLALDVEERKQYDYITTDESVINTGAHYSTEETRTGMYWIDGKPIYRKVFFNNDKTQYLLGNSGTINISMLSPNEAEEVIKFDVMIHQVTEESFITGDSSWYNANCLWNKFVTATGKTAITSMSNGGNYYVRSIVLEYTKTAD